MILVMWLVRTFSQDIHTFHNSTQSCERLTHNIFSPYFCKAFTTSVLNRHNSKKVVGRGGRWRLEQKSTLTWISPSLWTVTVRRCAQLVLTIYYYNYIVVSTTNNGNNLCILINKYYNKYYSTIVSFKMIMYCMWLPT